MKRIRGFTVSPVISAIVLVVIICVGIYFAYALMAVQKSNDTMISESANNTNITNDVGQSDPSTAEDTSVKTDQTDETDTNTSSATSDETSDQKTYSSADYSFKYPSDWTLSSDASGVTLDTPGVKASDHFDNDRPYAITLTNTSLSKLDVQNLGTTSLKDYLDKYSKLSDPVVKNVTLYNIGNKSGFKAEAGPNQFGGGDYYYVETNNKIIMVWVFAKNQDASVTKILSTFEFTSK